MKKITYLIAMGALLPVVAQAQQTEIPAPKKATYIVEVNLPYIFSQMDPDHMGQSESARSLYTLFLGQNRNYEQEADLAQSGIDHSRKAFIHYVMTDSINYELRLLPVRNVAQFKKTMDVQERKGSRSIAGGKLYAIDGSDDKLFIPATETYGILIATSERFKAFQDSARAARYGITPVTYSDYYGAEEAAYESAPLEIATEAEAAAVEAAEEAAADAVEASEEETGDDGPPQTDGFYSAEASEAMAVEEEAVDSPAEVVMVETEYEEEDPYSAAFDQERYDYDQARYQQQVDSVMAIWKDQFLTEVVQANIGSYQQMSYMADLEYARPNSAFAVYFGARAATLSSWPKYMYGIGRMPEVHARVPEIEENWMRLELNFDPNAVNISAVTHQNDQDAARMRRMQKRRLNPKFARYINSNTDIGVLTMAVNTRNYLEEMPGMVKNSIAQLGIYGTDEASLLSDIFSLVLDEEAIGKVIWGDAAFVFTDVKEKTYASIEYTWDEENYKSVQHEVEKKEKLPNFLLMMTTKDDAIFRKLLQYAVDKELLTVQDGLYKVKEKKRYDPFDYYCLIKDGIIFIGTDQQMLEGIQQGVRRGGLSKSDQKLLMKHNGAGWLYASKLVGVFGTSEGSVRDMRVNRLLQNMGQMQFTTGKIKRNRMEAVYTLKTPNQKASALEYLIYLLDDMRRAW